MMFPFGKTGHEPLCKKSFFRFLTAEEVLARSKKRKQLPQRWCLFNLLVMILTVKGTAAMETWVVA